MPELLYSPQNRGEMCSRAEGLCQSLISSKNAMAMLCVLAQKIRNNLQLSLSAKQLRGSTTSYTQLFGLHPG